MSPERFDWPGAPERGGKEAFPAPARPGPGDKLSGGAGQTRQDLPDDRQNAGDESKGGEHGSNFNLERGRHGWPSSKSGRHSSQDFNRPLLDFRSAMLNEV
ncbi:hypothetical protein [Rhodoblastus sp.]|uniref:hypothetical protein n=1 Tax=Rhodoblastus sp. TaxID=1962975 RepID=UPI003F9479D6